jgi:hypothetical protein
MPPKRKGNRSPSGMIIPPIPEFSQTSEKIPYIVKPPLPSFFNERYVPNDQSILRMKSK